MNRPDRTLSSRYECKYLVDPGMLPAIRSLSRPFVKPDEYAAKSPGYRYPLSSLYLDNDALDLYETTVQGLRNRYKLRVRSYSDDPRQDVFFEIKGRSDQVVVKTRTRATRAIAQSLLSGAPLEGNSCNKLQKFKLLMDEISARPIMRVRYEREAYESIGNDPVRITFDTRIEYALTSTPDLSLNGGGWHPTPLDGVVLEIKFSNSCPSWVSSMINRLDLVRESIPKYVTSLDAALEATKHLAGLGRRDQLDAVAMNSAHFLPDRHV